MFGGAIGKVPGLGILVAGVVFCHIFSCCTCVMVEVRASGNGNVRMRFLVTVNITWNPQDPDNSTDCLTTAPTPFLDSDRSINETHPVTIGSCDHGPLVFGVSNGSRDKHSKMDVYITFYSTYANYPSPPTCYIPWNGTYLNPSDGKMDRSPLPSCFTRANITSFGKQTNHIADYWFHLLEWQM